MYNATLGPALRTALAFVVLATIAAVAALWRTLSGSLDLTVPETLTLVAPVALVTVVCTYYAAHG